MEEIVRRAIEDYQRRIFHLQIVAVLALIVYVLFLWTLFRAMRRVSLPLRRLPPLLIWLNLVPYLYTVWGILTVHFLSLSLRDEARLRGKDDGSGYGRALGIGAFACSLLNLLLPYLQIWLWRSDDLLRSSYLLSLTVGLNGVLFVGGWVLTFVYWMQIAHWSRRFARPFELDEETYVEENPMEFLGDDPAATTDVKQGPPPVQ
jgi:hypothetical protein